MDTCKKVLDPDRAVDICVLGGHNKNNDKTAIVGASCSNSLQNNSDDKDMFVCRGENKQYTVYRGASNTPMMETPGRGRREEHSISEIKITTSFDIIIVSIPDEHDSVYYKLNCKEAVVGILTGPLTREGNQYIRRHLAKNTEYIIEVQKFVDGLKRSTSTLRARTLFCSPPYNVSKKVQNNAITFTWEAPLTIDRALSISEYILEVYNYTNDKVEKLTRKPTKKLKINYDLDRKCSYRFTLYAKAGDLVGSKVYHEHVLLKHRLCKMCDRVVNEKGKTMFLLKHNETKPRGEYVAEKDFGDPTSFSDKTKEKIILLVGETGTGKTTWINAFVNFLFGVTREDPFRFKLIQEGDEDLQTESKTQCVTIYRLRHQEGMAVNYDIILVDTPGFGDTRGIGRDTHIETEIHALFGRKNGYLEYINAVAFVMPVNNQRLTHTMKYILDSIMSLFGKDLNENLILLGTHGTAKPKKAIEALKGHNIQIKKSYHFENAEVLKTKCPNDTKGGKNTIWATTMKMFKELTTDLDGMSRKSVSQTQDVLDERERIKIHVARLQMHINDGIKALEQFKKEQDYLQEKDNGTNYNTTASIPYSEIIHIQDDDRQLHNNCKRCKVTCHVGCLESDSEHCIAFERRTDEASCMTCINKCPWRFHSLQPFKIEHIVVQRLANEDHIGNRYLPTGKTITRKELCEKLKNDFEAASCRVKASISEIDQALKKLDKIALLSWPKSQIDYIDKLIVNENQQMQEGYRNRLELLRELKQEAEHLQSIDHDSGKFDPFGQYRRLINEVVGSGYDATNTSTLVKYLGGKLKSFFSRGK